MSQLAMRRLGHDKQGRLACVLGAAALMLAGLALQPHLVAAASTAPESPTVVVRTLLAAIRHYRDGTGLSRAQRQENARALRIAGERLDVTLVAERAFGKRWATLTAAQRRQFIEVFTTLLEHRAYPKSRSFFADLDVEYLGEEVRRDRATVETVVFHPEEGEIGIDYHLQRRAGRWVIVDVVLDGASLALDIRAQIQKVLADDSFAALIERMKDRLAEG